MNKKIPFAAVFLILLIIIYIFYQYSIASIAQIINTYGVLILASVALLAVFYPNINKSINKPKFNIDTDFHKEWNNQLRLKIKNVGKSMAHSCKVYIEIYDECHTAPLKDLFLPWDMPNYHINVPGTVRFVPVTYDVINLYVREYQFVKLFFYFSKDIFSIYGSPFYESGVISPPIVADNPRISSSPSLALSKEYRIVISIFSEEVSYIKLKTLYFKIDESGSSYSYNFEESKI